jgi:hypothetical protein
MTFGFYNILRQKIKVVAKRRPRAKAQSAAKGKRGGKR